MRMLSRSALGNDPVYPVCGSSHSRSWPAGNASTSRPRSARVQGQTGLLTLASRVIQATVNGAPPRGPFHRVDLTLTPLPTHACSVSRSGFFFSREAFCCAYVTRRSPLAKGRVSTCRQPLNVSQQCRPTAYGKVTVRDREGSVNRRGAIVAASKQTNQPLKRMRIAWQMLHWAQLKESHDLPSLPRCRNPDIGVPAAGRPHLVVAREVNTVEDPGLIDLAHPPQGPGFDRGPTSPLR